ncbi:hypothetical protein N864_11690 [Intrasporangium chromatireducens Q5-1]|uniref:Helicase n=1 Tax=Intrasporangium chromatireducens Q5-1 TaxID=584657 RepID=W9GPA7_9MICO|nr:AAA family ATPase [Intrasporangium chromatireducens]EWT07975.1 hypothetical protein N864_11690 [Intrasporangium chromatireducens Q5-1]
MTSTRTVLRFTPPTARVGDALHHASAAAGNVEATTQAIETLSDTLTGSAPYERILLRAAAGAGKSYALKRMVEDALAHRKCARVGVTAFANKQVFPLAEDLGRQLGRERVCILVSRARAADVPDTLLEHATVVFGMSQLPEEAEVFLMTSHMLERAGWSIKDQLGPAADGEHSFDVLFVDEAWQLPLHRYRRVDRFAPVVVGVGDVGQLPPIDPNQNPWRGDPGYNPYRAWPTAYAADAATWSTDLPAVWRPTAAQLPLWRAFYSEWEGLNCVAAPGDRSIVLGRRLRGDASAVWSEVAAGVPTLVEVEGLDEAEAADIDLPLLGVVEGLLDQLLRVGFELRSAQYDGAGLPVGERVVKSADPQGDPLIAVLATRNQAVDDATEMVERLVAKHDLADGVIVASTVDSWQGQTNGVTVAIHPLSGASALDEFNSAFGRLAVTCTRATHGLLMVSRSGLRDLLAVAPARPGIPLGEPGPRELPRQTHQRILDAFARTTIAGT